MNLRRTVLLMALPWAPLAAQAPAARTLLAGTVRQGTLSFDGRATTGSFSGTSSAVSGEMHGSQLSEVRGWVETPVRTLTTGNQRRDRDLNKSMESGRYPTIRFELTGVTAPVPTTDSVDVVLVGRFIIHGVTRAASVPANVAFHPDGIRVRAETPLNVKDYKIGGLSKALGMLKMDEKILLHVDLTFGAAERSPPGTSPS